MSYRFIPGDVSRLPMQARAIIQFLMILAIGYDQNTISEAEIRRLMSESTIPDLVTRQQPYRLWQYYRSQFVQAGLIRPTR